ncbi:MAG: hypothetical protein L0220_15030, partial [Acidobacteria bacterium]|nr:hypothetical protein [Acidobacteriota bacterium]
DIEVEGENDVVFGLFDVYGESLVIVDDNINGLESGSATTSIAAPYFLFLAQFSREPGEFHINSNRPLIPFENKDNGRELVLGQTIRASLDHPSEIDYFVIDLAEGETISISVDAIMIDPYLQVDFPEATEEQLVYDDDSGGGLLGSNSELIYRAPQSGPYFITVQDALGTYFGGYFLTVAEAPPGAIPVTIPSLSESTTPFPSDSMTPTPSTVILTLDDLPPGFEAISPEEFGFSEGKLLAGETTIEHTFAFIEAEHFEFIFGFTTSIPNRLEQVGFDVALRNPDFLLEALVEGLGTSEILEQKELSLPTQFGEASVGMTVAASLEGTPIRMDMIVFRQSKLGVLIAVMYLEGDSPVVPIGELAQILDERVKESGAADTAILAPTSSPRPEDTDRQIVFHSDRDANTDIYRMNADGSNLIRLTDDPAADWSPAWSPDGQTIAFMSDRDNNFEIYLMQPDGTNLRRLTDNPGYDGFPAWSPDGRTIAYLSQQDGQETDL